MIEVSNLYRNTADKLNTLDADYATEEAKLKAKEEKLHKRAFDIHERAFDIHMKRETLKVAIACYIKMSEHDFYCSGECSACDEYEKCEKCYDDIKKSIEENYKKIPHFRKFKNR